jgi:hypothetical protein
MEFDELTRVKGTQELGNISHRTLVVRKDKKEHVVFSPQLSQKTHLTKKKGPQPWILFFFALVCFSWTAFLFGTGIG